MLSIEMLPLWVFIVLSTYFVTSFGNIASSSICGLFRRMERCLDAFDNAYGKRWAGLWAERDEAIGLLRAGLRILRMDKKLTPVDEIDAKEIHPLLGFAYRMVIP